MDPQYAIDLAGDVGQIYELNAHGGFYNWIDGTAPGDTGSTGLSYSISGNVVTLDLPSADFGLSGYSGATLNFVALEVSETGFSSGEATATLTGAEGWGNTQTLTSVNSFTAVPEPGSWGLLAGGLVVLSGMPRLRRMRRV
jgi:hypothetical protein